ncbi:MAG: peptidoglycan-binding protein [Azoarcus sp.]|nr:peptidoglycan-binding protein [Azoarcus sp.]
MTLANYSPSRPRARRKPLTFVSAVMYAGALAVSTPAVSAPITVYNPLQPPIPLYAPVCAAHVHSLGSNGPCVVELQLLLNFWLSPCCIRAIPVTGRFDGPTFAAVQTFQRLNHLKVNGRVDATVVRALYYVPPPPVYSPWMPPPVYSPWMPSPWRRP